MGLHINGVVDSVRGRLLAQTEYELLNKGGSL